MQLPSKYILDRESIKQNTYRLVCLFYANKEISRNTDPGNRNSGIAKLEDSFFFSEFSRLLIEIAISIRVLDDQMMSLSEESTIKKNYLDAKTEVNNSYNCMMFDEMNLREVCNKIIHADVVEPHLQEVENDGHDIDNINWLGWSESVEQSGEDVIPEPEPIKWMFLTNNVRLGGKNRGQQWWHLLEIPLFVEAISELLA